MANKNLNKSFFITNFATYPNPNNSEFQLFHRCYHSFHQFERTYLDQSDCEDRILAIALQ